MLSAVIVRPATERGIRRMRSLSIFVPHASDCLTDNLPHGDGLVAFEFVSRLAVRGHTVHVAAPKISVTGSIPDTLHLHEMSVPGVRLRYMIAVRRLYNRLHAGKPFDIVHQLNPVFTGISLAFVDSSVPVVLGSFLADWPRERARRTVKSRIAGFMKRQIALQQQNHARALIVTTPGARMRIIDQKRNARKIFELPHGVDPSLYEPTPPIESDRPIILFLGGLEERKGIFTLLDAFPMVQAIIPDCRLLIGGWGGQHRVVERRIGELPDPTTVSMLGRVDRGDIPRLLSSATVFVMPSIAEPFGMSLLEAMASGKPVVVTDAGGPHHIVDDEGGRKVPVAQPAALAAALVEILSSPDLRARMGAHNRNRIEDTYSWDHVIDRLESLYSSVLSPVRSR